MLKIVCIIMARNAALTIGPVLEHLKANSISVVFVDHGSTDATSVVLDRFDGDPVVERRLEPFDGTFRLARQLQVKSEIIASIDADWVIHLDADEILESPVDGESLREFLERVDATSVKIVDCDEFVFAPETEHHDYTHLDFVSTMRRYYHFAPVGRHLQRVFRAKCDTAAWGQSGGHYLDTDTSVTYGEQKLRLRHYIGLSIAHLREQYLGRVFHGDELRRGWHHNRVPTTMDFIRAPDASRMFDLDRDGWRTDSPCVEHLVFWQPAPYSAPPILIAKSNEQPPAPFIVGTGRSGTTLLRMLLDKHSVLSIPPETHWLTPVMSAARAATPDARAESIRIALTNSHNWVDMGFDDAEVGAMFNEFDSGDFSAFLRSIYRRYALRHGAIRFGDKTPLHLLSMVEIAQVLPEARFIHIIRDGRDVATSHRKLWFGPGDDMEMAATMWMWRIARARQQAEFLPYYMEVRYEDLVSKPRQTLKTICDFIDLEFEESQLQAHYLAPQRLLELGPLNVGGRILSAEQRRSIHAYTAQPPDPSRVGRFRDDLTTDQICRFERVAGKFLQELGYAPDNCG